MASPSVDENREEVEPMKGTVELEELRPMHHSYAPYILGNGIPGLSPLISFGLYTCRTLDVLETERKK